MKLSKKIEKSLVDLEKIKAKNYEVQMELQKIKDAENQKIKNEYIVDIIQELKEQILVENNLGQIYKIEKLIGKLQDTITAYKLAIGSEISFEKFCASFGK